jgi:hypothetical protein
VQELLAILRESPVVHADESGWRINGKNVWCWCFSNPKLAVFLIYRHRSAAVVREVLGDSLQGVLVTDFYAAYHAIECRKSGAWCTSCVSWRSSSTNFRRPRWPGTSAR